MVSVPWMTTTPRQPLSSAPLIAAASSNRSPKVRDAPGLRRKSTMRRPAPMAPSPGTAASSSGADRAGDTPPPGACVIAIVPPSPKTVTPGLADSLTGSPTGEPLNRSLATNHRSRRVPAGLRSQARREWRVVVGQKGIRRRGSRHLAVAAGQLGANGLGEVRQVREHREEGVVSLRGQGIEVQRDGDRGKGLGT